MFDTGTSCSFSYDAPTNSWDDSRETTFADRDTELMLSLQDGDVEAFDTLLERNHVRVVRLAHTFGFGSDEAEDIAQETFLRIYQARERYVPGRRFSSYMFRIAANVCISRQRRLKGRRTTPLDAAPERASHDPVHPLSNLLREELRAKVRRAVGRLPSRQQRAIRLQRFEELSTGDVAAGLGLSVPATKSLLHRARLGLRDMLVAYAT